MCNRCVHRFWKALWTLVLIGILGAAVIWVLVSLNVTREMVDAFLAITGGILFVLIICWGYAVNDCSDCVPSWSGGGIIPE